MTKGKNKLKPQKILTIDTDNTYNISIIVTNSIGELLYMNKVLKTGEYYHIRQSVLNVIDNLIQKYEIDTILFEQNKLFIDKIDRYPDPIILKNILLGFGIQITIEDRYYKSLTILAIPEYEWKSKVLGRKVMYAIDLYKAHILHRTNIPIKYLINIENNNYYKAICLSESILFDALMDKKYQINKGD